MKILRIMTSILNRKPMNPPVSNSNIIIPVGTIPLFVSRHIPVIRNIAVACLPIFLIGLRPLGLPFCARPGRKKYRSVARMIFSCPAKPVRAALRQKAGNPRPLPLKSGKTDSFLYGHKKMQTFRPAFLSLFSYRCYSSF